MKIFCNISELETVKKIFVLLEKDTKQVDDAAAEKGVVLKTKEEIESELKEKYKPEAPKPNGK